MTQAYSDSRRESDPYALPDVEVFHSNDYPAEKDEEPLETGWYWRFCFPGCLPGDDSSGPFATEAEALVDAQEWSEGEEEEDEGEGGTLPRTAAGDMGQTLEHLATDEEGQACSGSTARAGGQ